ncbi:MAG: hypothetical protein ACR2LR_00210 [Hassallia sp.]
MVRTFIVGGHLVKQPILSSTSIYSFSAKVVSSDVEIPVSVVIFYVKN